MRIDSEKCVGCGRCVSYCPVGTIHVVEREDKSGKRDHGLMKMSVWSVASVSEPMSASPKRYTCRS